VNREKAVESGPNLTAWERAVLERFISVCLSDDATLVKQVDHVLVSERDPEPRLIYVGLGVDRDRAVASKAAYGPYDLRGRDRDGELIDLMLFIVDGYLAAVEGWRQDDAPIQQLPDPAALETYEVKRAN
jgi:hypothetical protein